MGQKSENRKKKVFFTFGAISNKAVQKKLVVVIVNYLNAEILL